MNSGRCAECLVSLYWHGESVAGAGLLPAVLLSRAKSSLHCVGPGRGQLAVVGGVAAKDSLAVTALLVHSLQLELLTHNGLVLSILY